ncbi:MAG: hypothetical protein IT443_02730 [Phycisphaeraceae bacterium]|nr:hypothetical protein [Phycisphaeraceae bacterium]
MAKANLTPVPLGLKPSFGFGDRLGLATSGHLDALKNQGQGISGIFAQQSIREMKRTNRTPTQVMQAAQAALAAANYAEPWGADADHLKTPADVDVTAAAGFVFFTIDPSDHVDTQADNYVAGGTDSELARQFAKIKDQTPWVGQYVDKPVSLPGGLKIAFDATTVQRAAVKYGRAIRHTIELAGHIQKVMAGKAFEIELSVDETPQPTTLAEHYIIADQLRQAGVKVISLAPRYVGDFEKGIDFKGDIATFQRSLTDHAAIARHLGPYKLSLHSGSDKLSIYTAFARVTGGLFHVKTAGTSYLEALRVVARHDDGLFRRIVDFSRGRFAEDRATYHISAELGKVAPPSHVSDKKVLEKVYLDENDGRQILHVTFGSVLTDATLGLAVKEVLKTHPKTHTEVLTSHFGKHLAALKKGM